MGSIAKRHISNLRIMHPSSIIYVVSSTGKNLSKPQNADYLIEVDDLLKIKLQLAIIASPSPFHVDVAKKLLKHNIPTIIEKPVSDKYENCIDLKKFCDSNEFNTLAVGYCLRFLPSAKFVKTYLENGNLGDIYNVICTVGQFLPLWRTDIHYIDSVSANKKLGGGALLELSHELDYLLWIFGDLCLQHSSLRKTNELKLEVEDIANLVLISTDNVYINVHLDFIQKSNQRKCEVIGEKGRILWDLINNEVTLYNDSGKSTLYSNPDYDKNNMYLDMLHTFENDFGNNALAKLESSSKILKIIDEAKLNNSWKKKA